jgi:hypothetical protein
VPLNTSPATPPQEEVVKPEIVVCPLALPTRITSYGQATTLVNLNLRDSPDITPDNWIMSLPSGTEVSIIEGPVCYTLQDGAFLWWGVETENGISGWSAEGSHNGVNYFLEPIPDSPR